MEISEVSKRCQEVETRKQALISILSPYIESYFATKARAEADIDLRRDYADLMKSRSVEFVSEDILNFSTRNWSGIVSQYVTIEDLLQAEITPAIH